MERKIALMTLEYLNNFNILKYGENENVWGLKTKIYIYKDMEIREKHISNMKSKGYEQVESKIMEALYSNLMANPEDDILVPTATFKISSDSKLVTWIKKSNRTKI